MSWMNVLGCKGSRRGVRFGFTALLVAVGVLAALGQTTQAATVYWDPGITGGTTGGGTGSWDLALGNWFTPGTGDQPWNNAGLPYDDAVFQNSGGTVNVADYVSVKSLTFNSNGYTIASSGNIPITLDASGAPLTGIVTVTNSTDTATISAEIDGGTGLAKDGDGTLVITNSNNFFSGGIYLNAGTLQFANLSTLNANVITFNGGTLQWATGNTDDVSGLINIGSAGQTAILDTHNSNVTFGNSISGAGGITKTGAGTLTLGADNGFSGPTTINQGKVVLDSVWALEYSTVTPNVNNGLAFAGGVGSFGIGGLSGSNNVSLIDAGSQPVTLDIGGNNQPTTYGGSLSGGTVTMTQGTGVLTLSGSSNSAFEVGSGALDVAGFSAHVGPLVLSGGSLTGSGGTLSAPSIELDSGTVSANLAGPSNITKTTGGTVYITAANTFGGTTTINGGTLRLMDANALQNSTVAVNTTDGTGLYFNSQGDTSAYTLGGLSGTGLIVLNDTNNHQLFLSVGNNNASTTFSGQLVGGPWDYNGVLTKIGTGTLTLAASAKNTYGGGTVVNGGVLKMGTGLNNIMPFDTGWAGSNWDGDVTVGASGTFNLNGTTQKIGGLYGSGLVTDTAGGGTLQVFTAGNPGPTTANFSGVISGTGLNVEYDGYIYYGGAQVLSGTAANTYTGTTQFDYGTFILSKTGAVSVPGNFIFQTANGGGQAPATHLYTTEDNQFGPGAVMTVSYQGGFGDFELLGTTQTLAGFNGDFPGVMRIYNCLNGPTNSGNSTLVINCPTDTDYPGEMHDGSSGTLGLTKSGAGTLTLRSQFASSDYSGPTTINQGKVLLASYNFMQNSTAVINVDNGLTFSPGSGPFTLGGLAGSNLLTLDDTDGSPVQVTVGNNNQNTTFSGSVAGDGSLVKTGSGLLCLSGNSNGFTGSTTISSGTLQLGSAISNGSLGGDIIDNDTLVFSNPTAQSFAGTIGGTGAVVKLGAGVLSLTGGPGTFTGAITIGAGQLQLGNSNVLANGTPVVDIDNGLGFAGGILAFNIGGLAGTNLVNLVDANGHAISLNVGGNDQDSTFSGTLSGAGSLVKSGAGLLVLAGSNGYSGGTTITGGVLQFNNAPPTSGTIDIQLGGALAAIGAHSTVTGWLGTGKIATGSAGAIALMGDSAETINMGSYSALSLGAAADAMYSGTLTPNGTTYRLGGGGATLTVNSALTGARSLAVTGPGTVILANSGNNYSLGTAVNSGTLDSKVLGSLPAGSVTVAGGATLAVSVGGVGEWDAPSLAGLLGSATFAPGSAVGIDTTDASGGFTYAGTIGGGAGVTKLGPNSLTFAGAADNTYAGATTVNQGELVLSQAGVAVPGALNVGNGTADAAVTMAQPNQFAPTTVVNFGPAGYASHFSLMGNDQTIGGVTDGGSALIQNGAPGQVAPGDATLTFNLSTTNNVVTGQVRDNADPGSTKLNVVVAGSGMLTLSGSQAFAYTGTTNVTGGTLNLVEPLGAAGAYPAVTVAAGATLELSSPNHMNQVYTILGDDTTNTWAGELPVHGSGTLYLSGYNSAINNSPNGWGNFDAYLMSSFSGNIVLDHARLEPWYASDIVNVTSIVVPQGSQFISVWAGTETTPISIAGQGWYDGPGAQYGALRLETDTYAGPITLTDNARISSQGNGGFVTGNISGPYELEIGGPDGYGTGGTFMLTPTGGNTFASLRVTGSNTRVLAGNANALGNGGGLTMSEGTVETNGYSFSFGNLSGDSGAIMCNWGANDLWGNPNSSPAPTGASTITVGSDNTSTTFGGTLADGDSGTLAFVKVGNGTLTLTGTNTLTGGIGINGGVMVFANTNAIPAASPSITINAGGALSASGAFSTVTDWLGSGNIDTGSAGAIALTADSSETISMGSYSSLSLGAVGNVAYSGVLTPAGNTYRLGGGGGTLTYTPAITGANGLAVSGPGMVVLTNAGNNYSLGTAVNAGTLEAKTTSTLPGWNSTGITVAPGATLAVNVGGVGEWTQANVVTLLSHASFNSGSSIGFDTNDATSDFSYSNPISGAIGLTKLGENKLVVSNSGNNYTGDTNVLGGTVEFTSSAAAGDGEGSLNVSGDGYVQLDGALGATEAPSLKGLAASSSLTGGVNLATFIAELKAKSGAAALSSGIESSTPMLGVVASVPAGGAGVPLGAGSGSPSAVPEPGTLALLLAGALCGLAAWCKRRK